MGKSFICASRATWVVLLAPWGATFWAPAGAATDIVARIGEQAISVDDFETRALQLRKTGYGHIREWNQENKEEILDGIIARELLIMEGLRRSLDRDSTIAAEVLRAERKALMSRLYDREALQGSYTSTEEELRSFFVDRGYDTEVLSRHIVCRSRAEAVEVLAALDDGIPFESLVPTHSLPSIQSRFGPGGWVGWFKIGEVFEELREPLSTMPPGQVYPEPVKTPLGYHVFFLKTRRPVDFESSREFLRDKLRIQKRADDMERYVDRLRRRYRLEPNLAAFPALHSVPGTDSVFAGPDQVLFTWNGGQLTIQDYMTSLRARRAPHPASLDSAGLYKATDNLAGRRIMVTEARRLGLDRDPEVLAKVEARRSELVVRELFRLEGVRRARGRFSDEDVRAFYDQNLDLFTDEDGKVTAFEFIRDSIRTLMRTRARNDAMDAYIAELRQRYEDRIQVYPEALRLAFSEGEK